MIFDVIINIRFHLHGSAARQSF